MTRRKSVGWICNVLVALASWLTTALAVAAATNVIHNPGFEKGFNGWNQPRPRAAADRGRLDLAIDRRVVHGGHAAACLTLDFDQNAQFYCPTQTVSVFPDTEYLLTAWLRAELSAGTVHIELQDARGWQLFLAHTQTLSGRNDWTRVELAFHTSLTTEAVRIGLRHVGRSGDKAPMRGQIWLDDMSLVEEDSGWPRLTRVELERAIRESRLQTFENDAVRIVLAVPRLRVRELVFKQSPQQELATDLFPELPLYVITLEYTNGRTQEIRSVDAVSVSTEKGSSDRSNSYNSYLLRARHSGPVSGITVRATLASAGFLDLQLTQVDCQPGWSVRRLVFPQIVTQGLLSDKPTGTLVVIGGDEPVSLGRGWQFQMRSRVYPVSARLPILCQYGPAGGAYLMMLDSDQWVKQVEMQPVTRGSGQMPQSLVWRYVVQVAAGDPLPRCTARLGRIKRMAYEAAEVYRDWAGQQPWFPTLLTERHDVGAWRLRGVPHYFIYLPEPGPNVLPKPPSEMTSEERAKFQRSPGGGRFRLREVPAVIQQAYGSTDGRIGWVLVNHTDQRVTGVPQRPLPPWFSELQSTANTRRVTVTNTQPLKRSELTKLVLEPYEVVLIEQQRDRSDSRSHRSAKKDSRQ